MHCNNILAKVNYGKLFRGQKGCQEYSYIKSLNFEVGS